jgi:hypothetical protein
MDPEIKITYKNQIPSQKKRVKSNCKKVKAKDHPALHRFQDSNLQFPHHKHWYLRQWLF